MTNTSVTDASPSDEEDYYYDDIIDMTPEVMIPSAIGLTVLIIVGVGGNILTIAAYIRDIRMRKVYNYLILNLAIVDLLLCTFSMPFYAVYTLKEFIWPFGLVFCKIWMVIDFTCCFESILMMLIISVDRLLMLVLKTRYFNTVTTKRAQIIMGVSWFVSFLTYGPSIIGWDFLAGYSTIEPGDCDVEFAYDHGYTGTMAIIEFILPFVCLTSINALIFYKIRRKRREMAAKRKLSSSGSSTSKMSLSSVGRSDAIVQRSDSIKTPAEKSMSVTQKIKSKLQKSHPGKLLTLLVIAFLVCWLPYTVTTVMISFCDHCVNTSLYEFFNWLLWIKSALNPLLYAYNSVQYRANFRKILTCGSEHDCCGMNCGKIMSCGRRVRYFLAASTSETPDSQPSSSV